MINPKVVAWLILTGTFIACLGICFIQRKYSNEVISRKPIWSIISFPLFFVFSMSPILVIVFIRAYPAAHHIHVIKAFPDNNLNDGPGRQPDFHQLGLGIDVTEEFVKPVKSRISIDSLLLSEVDGRGGSHKWAANSGLYRELYRQFLKQKGFSSGKMAYSIPDTMNLDDTFIVEAMLSLSDNEQVLLSSVNKLDRKKFVIDTLDKLSHIVSAKLYDPAKGTNFNIEQIGPERKVVDERSPTIWQWGVTPIAGGGPKKLMLSVSTTIEDGFDHAEKDTTYKREVYVSVTLGQKVTSAWNSKWGWVCGRFPVLVGIGGGWRLLSRARRREISSASRSRRRPAESNNGRQRSRRN